MSRLAMKKKIVIYTTGGTIEKVYDESEGVLSNKESVIESKIRRHLRLPHLELEIHSIMSKDSLHLRDEDREVIFQKVITNQKHPIIVLHGTDTMDQTMRYCLKKAPHVNTPVIFTGAMKPLHFEDTDALQNVTESLFAAQTLPAGYYLVFHGQVFKEDHFRKNKEKRTFEKI